MTDRFLNLGIATVMSLLGQVFSAVAGVLVVQTTNKPEYALFILTLGMISAISSLADTGIMATLLKHSGRLGPASPEFADLVRQGLRFRNLLAVMVGVPGLAVTVVVLNRTGATATQTVPLVLLVAIGSFSSTASSIFVTLLRQQSKMISASLIQLVSVAVRLGLIASALLLDISTTSVALMIIIVTLSLLEAMAARRFMILPAPSQPKNLGQYRPLFAVNLKRQFATSLFYVAQGQILTFSLALQGKANSLAEVAALGRFGIVFTTVALLISTIATPFVSQAHSPQRALRLYLWSSGACLLASGIGLALIAVIAEQLLSILGTSYERPDLEVVLIVVSAGSYLSAIALFMLNLNESRAWVRRSWLYIPLTVVWTALLLRLSPPTSTSTAASFGALSSIPILISASYCAALGYRDEVARGATSSGVDTQSG